MNSTATLEKISGLRRSEALSAAGAWLKADGRAEMRVIPEGKAGSSSSSSRGNSIYRLGDPVNHDRFGVGEVVAHWPDGTLLVRFQDDRKSRPVWPSLLNQIKSAR